MKIVAVIMAGGRGERFWPKSRRDMPKQFLSLTRDGKTMLQQTVDRISPLVALEDTFIVTNAHYKDLVAEQIQGLPRENILLEPIARNTAPCIGLAAVYIRRKYEDAVMLVLPSDHLIKYNELFIDTLKDATEVALEAENMVTIGVTPSYPETGYGYIHFGKRKEDGTGVKAYKVTKFVEKPNLETAKEYVASGKYLWNSGMFVWKASTILKNMQTFLPQIYEGLERIEGALGTTETNSVLKQEFTTFTSESIDYGIMERAEAIYTLLGNFGWDDVGSWLALERINTTDENGNVVMGNVITIDSQNSIIQGQDKLIATIGLENLIIVDTDNAILICNKANTQDVKKVIENLKICNRNDYL